MGLSIWQIAVVVILFLLLFGRGKIPQLMGDLAEGIKSFKHGMREDDAAAPAQLSESAAESVSETKNAESRA